MDLQRLLLLFGLGFLAADLRAALLYARYWRRRRSATLVWTAERPPFYAMQTGIAVALGLLLVYNLFSRIPPPETLFGEGMMFLYYAAAVPLGARIERGFYKDGVWTDRGFLAYAAIGGIAWREGKEPVLLLVADGGTARSLRVPAGHAGAVRRLLRDLVAGHVIHLAGHGLDLGVKDEREDI